MEDPKGMAFAINSDIVDQEPSIQIQPSSSLSLSPSVSRGFVLISYLCWCVRVCV